MNATVTVSYNGRSVSFELDGTELSQAVNDRYQAVNDRYLNNASRGFIADRVEIALVDLVSA